MVRSSVMSTLFLCIAVLFCFVGGQVEAVSLAMNMTIGYDDGSLTLLNCPAGSKLYRHCDPTAYKWIVFTWAFPSLVVAALLLIFFFLYIFGKYCCNCCGGRKQSPNFCCPENSLPALYSPFDLMRPLFFSVICFFLCVAGCIWCCIETAKAYKQFKGMSRDLSNAAEGMANSTYALSTKLISQKVYDVNSNKNVSVPLTAAFISSQQDVMDHIAAMKDNTFEAGKTFVFKYLWVGYVVGPLLGFFSLLGVIFAFCNCRRFVSMMLFIIFSLLGVATWFMLGLFMSTHFVVKQGCGEVLAFNAPRKNALQAITNCSDAVLSSNQATGFSDLNSFAAATCEQLWPMCYDSTLTPLENAEAKRAFDCSTLFTFDSALSAATGCASVTRAMLISGSLFLSTNITDTTSPAGAYALTNGYTCSDGRANCSASACASLCTPAGGSSSLSDVGRMAMSEVTRQTYAAAAEYLLEMQPLQYSTCTSVLAKYAPPLLYPCYRLRSTVLDLRQAWGVLGLGSLLAVFVYILGAKRFIAMSEALVPQYDDDANYKVKEPLKKD